MKQKVCLVLAFIMLFSFCIPNISKAKSQTSVQVTPVDYDYIGNFSEGLASISKGDNQGYIDKTGKEVIPLIYGYADYFSEGLAAVRQKDSYGFLSLNKGKWGYINKSGKEVVPFLYDEAKPYNEGLAAVRKDGKWGFINDTGREVVPFIYDEVLDFSEGLAIVRVGEYWTDAKYGYIDKTGKEVASLKYDYVEPFNEGLAMVAVYDSERNPKCGFIDKTGKEVIPLKYDYAKSFNEGLAGVGIGELGRSRKFGYVDKTGKEVVPLLYDNQPWDFNEGLAAVVKDRKLGFVDKAGKIVIPLIYNSWNENSFSEGLVLLTRDGELGSTWRGFVDKTGKEVISLKYDYAKSFTEGLGIVSKRGSEGEKYGFIDKTGKEVIPLIYDTANSFSEGLAIVGKGGYDNRKYGVIDKTGEIVIPLEYDGWQDSYDYDYYVKNNYLVGYKDGEKYLLIFNDSQSSPSVGTYEYIYDEVDPGETVELAYSDLELVKDSKSAKELIASAAKSMTSEQKQSPTGIDKITHFAEAAVAQSASKKVDTNNITINAQIIEELQKKAIETKTVLESTLKENEIESRRIINTDIKFSADSGDKLIITIDKTATNTKTDNVRVETSDFGIVVNTKSVKEDLTDNIPLIITVEEIGGITGLGKNHTDKDILIASGNTKTLKVSFNKGKSKENITISIPAAPGETKYQAVIREDGLPVTSKYNPNTGNMEAKINEGGIYTVKNNYKDFTDIQKKSREMQDAIRYLASKGIISGTSETTFNPDGSISRAEIAALIVRALGKLDSKADGGFKDVNINNWYFRVAGSSKQFGIIQGYDDNTFRGNVSIPKDQIVVVAARTLKNEMGYREPTNKDSYLNYTDKQSIPIWAVNEIALASRENLIVKRTDGKFNPTGTMTRGDAAIILKRLFDRIW